MSQLTLKFGQKKEIFFISGSQCLDLEEKLFQSRTKKDKQVLQSMQAVSENFGWKLKEAGNALERSQVPFSA